MRVFQPRDEPDPASQVGAIIVTYEPPPGLADRVRAIRAQVSRVWVVDNASGDAAGVELTSLVDIAGVEIVSLQTNRGLAAALNFGVEHAQRCGMRWALLLDHDSVPAADMVAQLLRAQASWPRPDRIAALAPVIDYAGSGIRFGWYPRARARNLRLRLAMPEHMQGPVSILSALGSGLLVDIGHYSRLGGMGEELFIDGVDTDFCLRACAEALDLVGVPTAHLHHHLGAVERHKLLGMKDVWPTHHSPQRHYYIARNRLHLLRRHARRYPGWFVFELRLGLINAMNMLLYERQRGRKLWMMAAGTAAGLLGRTGPRT